MPLKGTRRIDWVARLHEGPVLVGGIQGPEDLVLFDPEGGPNDSETGPDGLVDRGSELSCPARREPGGGSSG